MARFSNDADVLKYEPVLFGELHLPGQVISAGNDGTLSGVTFSVSGEDFVSLGVEAGYVIYLNSSDGVLDGAYEIVSVDSATQLTVSVVRANSDDDAIAPPAATDVSFWICSYAVQAQEAALRLTERFGIKPGDPASDYDVDDILEAGVLKQASTFAVISSVYAMLASGAEDECFWKKSSHYRKLFEQSLQRCKVSIDTDGDGAAEITTNGGSGKLVRA